MNEMQIDEKTIEKKLVNTVKSMGGIAPKFVSPGFDGMPDRLVLLPGGSLLLPSSRLRERNRARFKRQDTGSFGSWDSRFTLSTIFQNRLEGC
jgi:hypothetical protein